MGALTCDEDSNIDGAKIGILVAIFAFIAYKLSMRKQAEELNDVRCKSWGIVVVGLVVLSLLGGIYAYCMLTAQDTNGKAPAKAGDTSTGGGDNKLTSPSHNSNAQNQSSSSEESPEDKTAGKGELVDEKVEELWKSIKMMIADKPETEWGPAGQQLWLALN